MHTSPAFRLYAQDFFFGVITLDNAHVGAYMRLLCYQWDRGAIPDDVAQVAKIIAEPTRRARQIWTALRVKFERAADGTYRNARLEQERLKLLAFRDLQAEKGAKGGRQRAANLLAAATNRLQPEPSKSLSLSLSQKKEKETRVRADPSIWDQVLARLDTKVDRHAFYTWFQPIALMRDEGHALTIRVPNPLFTDWITKHFGAELNDALTEVGRAGVALRFVADGKAPCATGGDHAATGSTVSPPLRNGRRAATRRTGRVERGDQRPVRAAGIPDAAIGTGVSRDGGGDAAAATPPASASADATAVTTDIIAAESSRAGGAHDADQPGEVDRRGQLRMLKADLWPEVATLHAPARARGRPRST